MSIGSSAFFHASRASTPSIQKIEILVYVASGQKGINAQYTKDRNLSIHRIRSKGHQRPVCRRSKFCIRRIRSIIISHSCESWNSGRFNCQTFIPSSLPQIKQQLHRGNKNINHFSGISSASHKLPKIIIKVSGLVDPYSAASNELNSLPLQCRSTKNRYLKVTSNQLLT